MEFIIFCDSFLFCSVISQKFSDTCIMRVVEHFTRITSMDAICQPFNTKIFIASNNKVFVLRTDYKTSEQYSTIFDQNGTYLYSWWSYFTCSKRYLRIDSKIIDLTRKILKHRDQHQSTEKAEKQFDNQILNLENEIQKLMKMFERHDGKVLNKLKKIGNTATLPRKMYF